MTPLSVVVAQKDQASAATLAHSLHQHFKDVRVAESRDELLRLIPRNRAQVAVVDLELLDLATVTQLHELFTGTVIVCTHRLADEKLWADALAAGAADCCYDSDVRGIVMAAYRHFGEHAA